MLKFDTSAGLFEHIPQSNLRESNLLERYDLQAAIVASWELFKMRSGSLQPSSLGKRSPPTTQLRTALTYLLTMQTTHR